MFRTDHTYPKTVLMPLDPARPRDSDMGELSMSMPAPLPSGIEPLAPSRPVHPEVVFTDDEAEWLWHDQQRARAAWGAGVAIRTRDDQAALNPALGPLQPFVAGVDGALHEGGRVGDEVTALRAALDAQPQPPRTGVRVWAWLVGVALFAVGYLAGRFL